MKDLKKAFGPLKWVADIIGVCGEEAERIYNEQVDARIKTMIPADTAYGSYLLDEAMGMVTSKSTFGINMANELMAHKEDIVMVTDVTYLNGYICIDQLSGKFKYYFDSHIYNDLKDRKRMPKIAGDICNYMANKFGCIPVLCKRAMLTDLTGEVSHTYKDIARVMAEGDNSNMWNSEIKRQITEALDTLKYLPSDNKYYFIAQGVHGWYLKADAEKNTALKNKALMRKGIQEEANSPAEEIEDAE